MQIKNLFERDIFRPINGVVKADQLDDSSVWQELDEFVVTRRTRPALPQVLLALLRCHQGPKQPDMCWQDWHLGLRLFRLRQIAFHQGAFLPSCEIGTHTHNGESKQAVEFFESKIKDAMLFGDIKRAVASNTDVILFNIDSKADHGSVAMPSSP